MIGRLFLGRYETLRLLGEGGMGRVYLARQLDLGRQVVVKVMHDHVAAEPKFCERFQRETLLMARFQHPFAVTLYDASLNDPQGPCIVMEYVRGITLDMLLQRHTRLTAVRVGRLLRQLCEVLQAAHAEGIVHRDLKPANLMVVDPDTPYEHIKVMDFGLAKLLGSWAGQGGNITGTEFAIGTPGYMCPEQAKGEDMDHRGDLYSVGIILYELLTGRLPFAGSSTMDVMIAHATEAPPTFARLGVSDGVPPAVEAVVLACLAKDPGQRPANARDLAERFEAALAHEEEEAVPQQAGPDHDSRPSQPTSVGHRPAAVGSIDPFTIVHQFEAWMPEKIASYKLRGFVYDAGGEVTESVPGRIRVRLGGRGSAYAMSGLGSWLGIGRRAGLIDVELRLQKFDPTRESLLNITVVLRPAETASASPDWRDRCARIFCDLRGYLMGQSNA
jgi:serine/threonine-protein kinase